MKPSTIAASAWPTNFNLKHNPKALEDSTNMLLEFPHNPSVDLIRNCDLPPPQKVLFTARVRGREETETTEEKLELLKALRLSQTRAREAERKAAKLMAERDCIGRAFEDEARLVFCYRQSVKLLELRASKLQKEEEEEEEEDENGGGLKWAWALAICFSVVGMGFFLGYSCNGEEGPILINI